MAAKQKTFRVISYRGMAPAKIPLRLGTPAQFDALRGYLESAGFTESAVAGRLGIASFAELGSVKKGAKPTGLLARPFDALIRLFLECEPVPGAELEKLLDPGLLRIMKELGLLVSDATDPPRYKSTVGMCPTRGLFLVCDLGGELGQLAEDVVYPAILENTQQFLDLIPADPCGTFFDLGTGTGVAALMAAKNFAAHAWASDITERAAHFSEFNRRLNGIENATVVQGDMYEPVAGLQFDRIVTHPPYVPVAKPGHVFRDGGDDGELIIRRAIEGLPRNLAPGGQFIAQTLISDRAEEPAEDRIRKWLGAEQPNFDIALIMETAREPFDFVGRAMQKGTHRPEELHYWANVFRAVQVKWLVYGGIWIQKHAEEREPFTVRLMKGPDSGPAETNWALKWHTAAAKPGALDLIMNSAPARSPHLYLAVLHKMQNGVLVPHEYLLRVKHPSEAECKCPGWVAAMLEVCDGRKSGAEILNLLKQQGVIDAETESRELAEIFRKTSGLADVLRSALAPLGKSIDLAFVFGSVAQGKERSASDVDVFVVGDAAFADVVKALTATQSRLGREINPVVMSKRDVRAKFKAGDRFLARVAREAKLFLMGTEDDFRKLAKDRAA